MFFLLFVLPLDEENPKYLPLRPPPPLCPSAGMLAFHHTHSFPSGAFLLLRVLLSVLGLVLLLLLLLEP